MTRSHDRLIMETPARPPTDAQPDPTRLQEQPRKPLDLAAPHAESSTAPGEKTRGGIGCGWLGLIILMGLVGLGGAGFLLVREIERRGLVERLETSFGHVSLLPQPRVAASEPGLKVQVYYIVGNQGLAARPRRLTRPAQGMERIHLIAREIQRPPQSGLLRSPFPPGTGIRAVYLYDGVVWVDLDGGFLEVEDASAQSERLTIYALVNSFMLNDPTLQGVRLMVEGRPVETAWGWLDLGSPLGPDLSLVMQ